MRRRLRNGACLLILLGIPLGACRASDATSDAVESSSSSVETTTEPRATQPPTTLAPVTALVGEWERETTCEELSGALQEAGLESAVLDNVVGNGFLPDVTSVDQLADAANPCEGAVPRLHSHFFTANGGFGSRDWTGQQVDSGTYHLVDEDTFMIGGVTFDFQIVDDTLTIEPIIPDCERCFEAQWAVAVAYPGLPWQRVEDGT